MLIPGTAFDGQNCELPDSCIHNRPSTRLNLAISLVKLENVTKVIWQRPHRIHGENWASCLTLCSLGIRESPPQAEPQSVAIVCSLAIVHSLNVVILPAKVGSMGNRSVGTAGDHLWNNISSHLHRGSEPIFLDFRQLLETHMSSDSHISKSKLLCNQIYNYTLCTVSDGFWHAPNVLRRRHIYHNSVCPSVRHTSDPCLHCLRYRDMVYTTQYVDACGLLRCRV